jgi:hypothetical protein
MKDIRAHLDKIRSDASECLLLSNLATDGKREVFTRMAQHLNTLASELEKTIATSRANRASAPGHEEPVASRAPPPRPQLAARPRRMLAWLLMIVLGGAAGALFWTYKPAQSLVWSLASLQLYESSSAPHDNSKQAIATLISGEQAERELLSEQVTALAGRLDDLERTLNNLRKARAEMMEPPAAAAVGAETRPAAQADRPMSTVENAASAADNAMSLRQSDAAGPPGCTQFRSFDPRSGTYVTSDGRRRRCQ